MPEPSVPSRETAVDLDGLAAAVMSPEDALRALPPEERAEYERCRDSVIAARREGERIAREVWIG